MSKEENINRIAKYIQEGCDEFHRVGVELEQFLLHTDGSPATYDEVSGILAEIVAKEGGTPYYQEGKLLGVFFRNYNLSLEPGSQLEISIAPEGEIHLVEAIFDGYMDMMKEYLLKYELHFVPVGYHPTRKAADIPLIPKKRYEIMDRYFQSSGNCGYQMMRATASTQVSIDYKDEEDFRRKFRLANLLSPIFEYFSENTPIYEGKENHRHLMRSYIWEHVDPARCGAVPGFLENDFGFHSYAEYLYEVPMMLAYENGVAVETGTKNAEQYYENRALSQEMIEHLLSVVFPTVRVKKYIEIRCGDSLPKNRMIAYTSMVYRAFYEEKTNQALEEIVKNVTYDDFKHAYENLINEGESALVYGISIEKWKKILKNE